MKTLLYCLTPLFSRFPKLSTFPCRLQPTPPLLFLLSCFFGWMGDHTTFDVLFYLMILWIYTCWTLGPWCVFNATRCQVHWNPTHNVDFCWCSDLKYITVTWEQVYILTKNRELSSKNFSKVLFAHGIYHISKIFCMCVRAVRVQYHAPPERV